MKRTLKNILMIALILLMVCAMFFTMKYAKSNRTTAKNNQSIEQGESNNEGDMQEPPEMPDNQDMKELDKKQTAVTLVMNNQSAIGNISVLNDSDSSYNNIDFNGYKLYVNGVAINN